jgi:hypothetical protein
MQVGANGLTPLQLRFVTDSIRTSKQLSMSALVIQMLENSKLKDENFTLMAKNTFIKAENAVLKTELAALKDREIAEPSSKTNHSPNAPQRAESALSNAA